MTTITLTLDNLGEATALERGTWNGSHPLGGDPSVRIAMPRLLDELDRQELTATFCVEAINCGLNPDAVRSIDARGHELALHGWRHEVWSELKPDRERELMRRSVESFAALGLTTAGFRPPGGAPTAADPELLAEYGIVWWSPADDADLPPHGPLTPLPFSWEHVDAYLLMDSFAELRARRGDPRASLDAATAGARLRSSLTDGESAVFVLHPFLMLDEGWWAQVRRLLGAVAELVAAGETVCRTAGQAVAV
jgi:peptidoglycan-N-acetylglucosamine deacetylase